MSFSAASSSTSLGSITLYTSVDGSLTTQNPLIDKYSAKLPSTMRFINNVDTMTPEDIKAVYKQKKRIYENLSAGRSSIYSHTTGDRLLQKAICYGPNLFIYSERKGKDHLEIIDAITGETRLNLESTFCKLVDGAFYTCTDSTRPKMTIWSSSTLEKIKEVIIPIEVPLGYRIIPKDIFIVGEKQFIIFLLEQKSLLGKGLPKKIEYWICQLDHAPHNQAAASQSSGVQTYCKTLHLQHERLSPLKFTLSHETLCIATKDTVECLDTKSDALKILESYHIKQILKDHQLHDLITQPFEYHVSTEMIFLNFSRFFIEISRKNKAVKIESHLNQDISALNYSFVVMENDNLAVQKGNLLDVWDTGKNKKISENLKLFDEHSRLGFEAGILYEVNRNFLRFWEHNSCDFHPPLEICEISEVTSFCKVTLFSFDFILYIQSTFTDDRLNKLFIYNPLERKLIQVLEGTLVPSIYDSRYQSQSIKVGIDQLVVGKKDQLISPFDPEGSISLFNPRTQQYDHYDYRTPEPTIACKEEKSCPPPPCTPERGVGHSRKLAVIGLIAIAALGVCYLTYRYRGDTLKS